MLGLERTTDLASLRRHRDRLFRLLDIDGSGMVPLPEFMGLEDLDVDKLYFELAELQSCALRPPRSLASASLLSE